GMTAIRKRCSRESRPRYPIYALRFLEVREPDFDGTNGRAERPAIAPLMRAAFKGVFVLNSDYDFKKGQAALDEGKADAISFGRPFISNPDLTKRFAKGLALTPDDKATWYTGGATGYADRRVITSSAVFLAPAPKALPRPLCSFRQMTTRCSSLQGAVIVSIQSLSGNGGSSASLIRIRRPNEGPS